MRTFPTRKSWGSNKVDRVSLLSNPSSPPSSPRSTFQTSMPTTVEPVRYSYDQQANVPTPQKRVSPSAGAIQFVPAYEEAISPATTQPLSSPEQSFSLDNEPNHIFRKSGSPIVSGPAAVTPSPSASLQQKPAGQGRHSMSKSGRSNSAKPTQETVSSQKQGGGTRIARLASLFSSRAIVKGSEPHNEEPCPSPPRSESSTGYVGWPGTQDRRGGTVAVEQSSYEDSDNSAPARPRANPRADYHLAGPVVDNEAAAKSPLVKKLQTEADKVHRMATPMRAQVNGLQDIYGEDRGVNAVGHLADPWGMNQTEDESMSEVSTSYSKTSSAYFNPQEMRGMKPTHLLDKTYNRKVAASVMRLGEPQPPTEEALRMKDHFTPQLRALHATNAMGFPGLLDKTREVPNLMDGTESESTQSSVSGVNHSTMRKARVRRSPPDPEDQILEEVSSDIFDGVSRGADSDVFDGLSNAGASSKSGHFLRRTPSIPEDQQRFLGAAPREEQSNLNFVLLGGGLTTIQTTANDFTNRRTASDFDENLTNSDYDQYGFAKIPAFEKMATAGKNIHDRSLGGSATKIYAQPSARAQDAINKYKRSVPEQGSDASGSSLFSDHYETEGWGENVRGGLQQYYVHPDQMKIVVKKYRKMSNNRSPNLDFEDLEREEDATKAFALSEMRSRIMEKDIERGLERRGGTTVVDDLVLTPYNRAAMRIRDALVVAKAWRDGATPQDVVNTAMLTCRPERAYYVLRPLNRRHLRLDNSRSQESFLPQRYTWEEVCWVDDLELSQYRCHSIGPRHLRGFEMFTIGDCQSILLKLCNEQCQELRAQLNDATARQIDAEEMMKAEDGDFGGDGMMTEAEMTYLSSMEEVKVISHKLVLADKAFGLVRNRIQNLVSKYEALLVKFENDAESIAPSSVITAESSYYSDYTGSFEEEREREALARRARRAELRAELAAREANLAKQRTRELRKAKEVEIQKLQQKLNDLQSESSCAMAEREHSVVLARAIRAGRQNLGGDQQNRNAAGPSRNTGMSKIDEVKQRFRNRAAGRNSQNSTATNNNERSANNVPYARPRGNHDQEQQQAASRARSALFRSVGEEMFQHLDFYERSLKAVESRQ